jgi:hypothetical protein
MDERMMNDEITNKPDDLPPVGIPMYQITEDDLGELERCMPDLCFRAMSCLDNAKSRKQIEKVKQILSHVRWRYGPWSNVTEIPADGD